MKRMPINIYTIIAILLMPFINNAQDILINELVPSNVTFFDEYAQPSDWIELYNNGSTAVDLNGVGLSDRLDFDNTWKIGNVTLDPGEHLLVFASGRDKPEMSSYETIIDHGDSWNYIIPTQNISSTWRETGFNDSNWSTGNSGFGYGDGDDETTLSNGTKSIYLRKEFNLTDVSNITEVLLHMDYDDAFIAYINGEEIARANIGAPGDETNFNAPTDTDHEAVIYSGGSPELFSAPDVIQYLVNGVNVLTIQGYNTTTTSSDLTFIPFLTLGKSGGGNGAVADILSLPEGKLHADFKLGGKGESVYLFSTIGTILDSVNFEKVPVDVSYGRQTDGDNNFVFFASPTPERQNGGTFYTGLSNDSIFFSHVTGLYQSTIALTLTESEFIRYTIDGSDPDESSNLYTSPISISANTIVKAKIYESNLLPTETYVANYLFNANQHSLPIITLNTREDYLFDRDIGMYVYGSSYENNLPYRGANFWEDWEYPFHINYYDENKDLVINTNGGAKIFGGWSRANDQRSFSLFARADYGSKNFKHKFFNKRDYNKFEALVLRNSGNDWDRSFMRDGVMTGLMYGSNVDFQAYQPTVTYLNGEYWGMYNMREKINEHFVASLHNVDSDDIDLLEADASLIYGSNAEYIELRDFIQQNSIANDANYKYVMSQIDEDNFIEYFGAQIYYNNMDWPGNNIKYWKAKNGKWRWILFDTDFGLGVYGDMDYFENALEFALDANGPNWPNPPWATLFLRKFVDNTTFRSKFANRMADMMNSIYLPEKAHEHIDTLSMAIEDEVARHRGRWGHNYAQWSDQLQVMKNFFSLRPNLMRQFIQQRFNYPSMPTINTKIDDVNKGSIKLNSLIINEADWSGVYFENNPIKLTAVPKPGYKFDRWTGLSTSTNPIVDVNLSGFVTITAHFTVAEIDLPIVINEINYNSPDDPNSGDWVELHNYTNQNVDISSWVFKDGNDNHAFVIPPNTVMAPNGYLILTEDFAKFKEVHPDVNNFIGNFDFSLSSDGEALRVYNADGLLQDSVYYMSILPWPVDANDLGPTIELIAPDLDNVLPENWKAYDKHIGTPGGPNRTPTGVEDVLELKMASVYPNPAANIINIGIDLPGISIESIEIYDLLGKLQMLNKGIENSSRVALDISLIGQGHYIAQLTLSDGSKENVKFVKM